MKTTILSLVLLLGLSACRTPEPKSSALVTASTIVPGEMHVDALTAAPVFTPNSVPAQAIQNHWLPVPTMTPGAKFDDATDVVICVKGYSASVRNVPKSVKDAVYAAYGMQPGIAPCPCEVDHLISLELGGSNDKENLWPQPYTGQWNARQKDKLENYLHKQVCVGKITLQEAQKEIAGNWMEAYVKYGLDKP